MMITWLTIPGYFAFAAKIERTHLRKYSSALKVATITDVNPVASFLGVMFTVPYLVEEIYSFVEYSKQDL